MELKIHLKYIATMTSRDVQTGARLVLGDTELEKHALSTAHKAVTRFMVA